ncbi:DUF2336 domain-containing protein [Sphingomonas koreensis]|nr:DUF2336 domain-containing protein [Sphingomonas koreensis]
MSVDRDPLSPSAGDGAAALLARAAHADARAEQRLAVAASDLAYGNDRLDDDLRARIGETLAGLIAAIDADIGHHAARALKADAALDPSDVAAMVDRLLRAGLLDDRDLVRALVARARAEAIAAALPPSAPEDPDQPSLLAALASGADRVTASAATAYMAAEGRRRATDLDARRNDLPAELHHRLVWWVAAARRGKAVSAAVDRALVEAAQRALAAHDEGARLEAAANRLAAAIAPAPEELGPLLEAALADRRLALFAALLGHALGVDADLARDLVLDPGGERLWLALRALDLPRDAIARIGLTLAEADRRRDAADVPALLDATMAVTADEARTALASLRLPQDYRAALGALGVR